MRTSKERRKGNPSMPTTLSLYTVHLQLSNHSPCFDVPSESHPMSLHTISYSSYQYNHAISSDVVTYRTTSFSYQNIPPPSCRFFLVSQWLRLSVTQFLPHHLRVSAIIPKYLHTCLRRYNQLLSHIAIVCYGGTKPISNYTCFLKYVLGVRPEILFPISQVV
jgi:hypothetical protein